jgi:hypothetical protein
MFRPSMQALVTVIMLSACLYALFFHGQDVDQRWAYSMLGIIVTFWLAGGPRTR